MADDQMKRLPIVNAHAHVFTTKNVPPLLVKKFVPAPFHWFFHLSLVLGIYRLIRKFKGLYYKDWYRRLRRFWYLLTMALKRSWWLWVPIWLFGAWLSAMVFYYLYDFLRDITNTSPESTSLGQKIEYVRDLLSQYLLFPKNPSFAFKALLVFLVFLFVKSGRNLILFIFKRIFSFLKILPGKETRKLIERYLLIVKFAVYKDQTDIFSKMKDQFPPGSGFVLLPMDMEYMRAGRPNQTYLEQLAELEGIKQSKTYQRQNVGIHPFVFVDPRRIREDREPPPKPFRRLLNFLTGKRNKKVLLPEQQLFNYTIKGHRVLSKTSIVKSYIEEKGFSGFKIYPALGYYPFERELLPLWKYAADHGIPIMSHCIMGTIFYRGGKEKFWDEHWVFKDEETEDPLLLPEVKNADFQRNFTHPMNFLCLIEEPFLRILIGRYKDQELNGLFGYNGPDAPMDRDLKNLKICLAHYGGEDQWKKYLEKDSYGYSQQINKRPGRGIPFIKRHKNSGAIDYDRLAQLWKYVDWYSIISSMMMQYPNVYADISYILHNHAIFPLLKETLKPRYGRLRERVLFGTDFYVVRNHNSEKELYISSDSLLGEPEFDLIARENPGRFLMKTV